MVRQQNEDKQKVKGAIFTQISQLLEPKLVGIAAF